MFKVGDLILYGSTGVCRVTDIATRDFSGMDKNKLFYILIPLYQDCTIYAPVNNAKIFMRSIISKAEAEQLIIMIPTIRQKACHGRIFQDLAGHYEASLKTHDCAELMELTLFLHAKKQYVEQQKRKLGAVDERFMKRAEELLFGELAAALDIPRESVLDYIAGIVGEEGNENERCT